MSLTAFRPYINVDVSDAVEIGRGFFTRKSPEYLSPLGQNNGRFCFLKC